MEWNHLNPEREYAERLVPQCPWQDSTLNETTGTKLPNQQRRDSWHQMYKITENLTDATTPR